MKLLALTCLVMASASPVAAQDSFTLGSGSGFPGHEVRLPLYLTLSKNAQLESVVAVIELPAGLAYARAETAEASAVAIEVQDAEGKDKHLKVRLRAQEGNTLSSGMVGLLFLTIAADAPPQMASLPVVAVNGFLKGSRQAESLRGDAGSVTVYEPGTEPVMSCFFFTH